MKWTRDDELFEGTPEEIAAIRRLLSSQIQQIEIEKIWDTIEFSKYYNSVSVHAQEAMVEIAKKPLGYAVSELANHFGETNKELGGSLSSLTVRWKKDYKNYPKPVDRDYTRNMYTMRQEIVELLESLTLEHEERAKVEK